MHAGRREFLKSFSAVGAFGALSLATASRASAGAHAQTAPADAISGPYVDLRTGEGNKIAYARLQGDLDFGKQKYGWYKGYVTAVRPGKKVQDLFGFEGFGVSRLLETEDGGIAKILREVGLYTDLRSGEILGQRHRSFPSKPSERRLHTKSPALRPQTCATMAVKSA